MTAVDLFSGCGGISVGLRNAGIDVLAGLDVEEKYLCSFRHNFPNSQALNDDVTNIPPADLMKILGLEPFQLDLLVGGPPCQGFSKNVPRSRRFLEDSRNQLVAFFLNFCGTLKPRMIMMENVAEMKNGFDQAYTLEILDRLHGLGYSVAHSVLNAADYGVPQRRRRAFFIASREGEYTFPQQTHWKPQEGELFSENHHVTVWEAIGDLPSLEHGTGKVLTPYECDPVSDFQRVMRNGNKAVTNHIARELRPKQFERLNFLKPGQGLRDLPKRLQTKGGYSGAYGRLTKEMVAPTITRWVFHPGSGRWGHPVDVRTLTIREIARIQSFPDDYSFVGSFNDQAGQLGNAVPPILAERLARSITAQFAV